VLRAGADAADLGAESAARGPESRRGDAAFGSSQRGDAADAAAARGPSYCLLRQRQPPPSGYSLKHVIDLHHLLSLTSQVDSQHNASLYDQTTCMMKLHQVA